jgi:hypothetical protein
MCWLGQNSSAIQAICAILGLIGLIWYAWLTRGIHNTAIRQATASQRPLIVFLQPDETYGTGHYIRNMGNGPALGLAWKIGERNERDGIQKHWSRIGSLAVGDWSDLPNLNLSNNDLTDVPESGVRIHYSDFEGNYYSTVVFGNNASVLAQDSKGLKIDECFHLENK